MASEEFIASLFLPNIDKYILSVLLCFTLCFLLLKKKIRSIIDPFFISLIGFSFACSVALFLFFCSAVNLEHFVYFSISTFIFLYCLRINIPDKNVRVVYKEKIIDYKYYRFFFIFCAFIYLFTSIYSMYINGIPLFNENRFAQNVDNSSGILGILGRFKGATGLYVILYSFFLIGYNNKRSGGLLLLLLVLMSFLSGSKGFILTFVYSYFFYCVYFEGKNPSIKKKYIPIIVLTPIMTIVIGGLASSGSDSFLYLGYRILAYGDIYWNAYPNDVIDTVSFTSPLTNMTYMFWGPFRHLLGISVSEKMMTTGGALLFENNYTFFPEGGAPNSPITIMSWIYYKWYGLILVGLIGWICSYFYYRAFKKEKRTLPICCLRAMICTTCLNAMGDIYLAFNNLFNIALFYSLYIILNRIYNLSCRKYGV